jgi:hypothetical protein
MIALLLFIVLFTAAGAFAILSKRHAEQTKKVAVVLTGISAEDDSIFHMRLQQIKAAHIASLPIGERIAKIGKLFLSTPYVGGTLDLDSAHEDLVINLHGLDCVTFYENSWALARLVKQYSDPTIQEYIGELTLLRYRYGKREGYHSRLHYTTDYFANAELKNILQNKTAEIGGDLFSRDTMPIDFMTTHRLLYKQIAHNDQEFAKITQMEANLNAAHEFIYIPKGNLSKVEQKIETGDIIGITTNLNGLDFTHTGIAVREADARIHFLHASSLKHKVIITDVPLAEYLANNNHQTGVAVMRPVEVTSKK